MVTAALFIKAKYPFISESSPNIHQLMNNCDIAIHLSIKINDTCCKMNKP